MTTLSSEAVRLADWLQATVNMYPQMSEDEPGGYATEFDQKVDEAAALLRRIPELEKVRVPDGWKLVPVEPTREMLDRGSHNVNCNYHYGTMETIAKHGYKAMLTATPTPPNADQKGQ